MTRRRPSAPVAAAVATTASRVFLDSGIFIALFDRTDAHHEAAVALFSTPALRWCTSTAVVGETYGWFLHRLGEPAARMFRVALADFTGLRLLGVDEAMHRATLATLDRHRGHKLSYVDAASLVLLGRERIRTVWGTDHHLAIEGAVVLPG